MFGMYFLIESITFGLLHFYGGTLKPIWVFEQQFFIHESNDFQGYTLAKQDEIVCVGNEKKVYTKHHPGDWSKYSFLNYLSNS